MFAEDQQAVIDLLADVRSYPDAPAGARVDRIDTHSATVFLVGDRAYKLKRAVRYDYLDFSTRERRKRFCEAEVALNRRTAPDLYLGVVPVTRDARGQLAIDVHVSPSGPGGEVGHRGPGDSGDTGSSGRDVVDWVVAMRRFPDDQLLDRLASRGRLAVSLMPPLARAIVALHAGAEQCPDRTGVAAMRWVVDGNADGFMREGGGVLDAAQAARVTAAARTAIDANARLLDARAAAGCIRVCHGDLHLRNIVLMDGRPLPFDAVEFNDDIACIDVFYDLAFLLMDLWRLDLREHANVVLNEYLMASRLDGTVDAADAPVDADGAHLDALALLPLFLSCRAGVRAKTGATGSRLQAEPERARQLADGAREYLGLAERLLQPVAPRLVVVAGLSGTGKSTIARAIAPHLGAVPGALVLRSDVIRKRLMGVGETERLSPEGYTPAMHARVYGALIAWTTAALRAGHHSVVVDAVFAREEERQAIEAVARTAGVRFDAIWLDAPADVLRARVRQRTGDASDATERVVNDQLARGAGTIHWTRVAADGDEATVVERVRSVLV